LFIKSTRLLACLVVLLLLVGCGADDGENRPEATPEPGSTAPFESPLQPTPTESLSQSAPTDSPSQPTATPVASCLAEIEPVGNTICGYIISRIDGKPVAGRPVFLAEALFSADNSVVLSALHQETAPQGVTDEQGMFYVTDVPANMYFLMIDDYPQPIMLKEVEDPDDDLYVDWREQGGVVDVGVLFVGLVSTNP
jgi:hypothetical protein